MIHRAYLAKKNNEKFVVWGDGKPLRQFLYSEDLAKLILWSIDNWKSDEHCMIINEKEISVMDVATIIKNRFEFSDDEMIFDESKPNGQFRKPAKSHITDYEFKSINDGIDETINWFISNYNLIRK
jgi:GDP-L-fucose synthase